SPQDLSTPADAGTTCTLINNTTSTGLGLSKCYVLSRDASACSSARSAAGLSGYWLKFSCRVTLSKVTVSGKPYVRVVSDNQPDTKSNYFQSTDPCYESYAGGITNPNRISAKSATTDVPETRNTTQTFMGGFPYVGVGVDGVVIFSNQAAPGDDIYQEA